MNNKNNSEIYFRNYLFRADGGNPCLPAGKEPITSRWSLSASGGKGLPRLPSALSRWWDSNPLPLLYESIAPPAYA
ncbi:hypothetical protein CO115_02810 [Candidatus Falkowbacteria bacterium CG_4_9_14_3_um_filter_36_9]|uniref:Uncharacterized protein n=2 Tax=Candidatus Falkowiibacteriota TaxID=1752728 RepID=A0A1J4TAF7_9BACT|nr:MAG: hypothetical protein AUJ27_00920 [Candidatus Falkowbacteria bacterium CG1_02_37_44]PIV50878.1 MAG: hypothetical protein COS18_03795 [Candidatus Falkowbacteria bacterium CG02_land_8_20_14_3_00_36_14]PIX11503.1 MAG: hypothetical protein COZ73_02445 [Candidatus Falkowbacteria bacterium CG_4_8_14_3_um_filter_36_11]PJA10711.1 MAG: hypothetical protein COX67_03595 [Candidatus Falkowbacteria bacterium CG_4_10_14_0_2_um_filter_36_22]PJB19379.1 MAG: hypothetical protein CO115_02810 [Candidatus F